MLKMGFDERWVHLAMQCVSTASYSVLLNGEPHGLISPSKRIKQGDPLSPYLFSILCGRFIISTPQGSRHSTG